MKSPPRARSPTLLRILLYSGFGAKCGAPHFAPLLPNTQVTETYMTSSRPRSVSGTTEHPDCLRSRLLGVSRLVRSSRHLPGKPA